MADYNSYSADKGAKTKSNSSEQDDMLSLCRERLKLAISMTSSSRQDQLDDLRFAAGSPDNQWQWPGDVLNSRSGMYGQSGSTRPCLTINKLQPHIKQVTNDQKQNRPSIKVIPASDDASQELAEVFNGVIRNIEYLSDADVAYDTACENQVTYGEGFIRLYTEYCDDTSFDQDIKIGRIRNSFSVYMDPMIEDPTGSDAQWCFITEDMSQEEYQKQYPDAAPVGSLREFGIGDESLGQWVADKNVRIAEYFYYECEYYELNLYPGNITAVAGTPPDQQLRKQYGKPIKSRHAEMKRVKWCKTNGYEIIDEGYWPGKFIPVVRVVGNEFEVEGQLHVSGLVRNAKDAQRMYNYWVSQEAEMLALAPKAPFIGYAGQFEGFEKQWKTANINNWPYLEVNPDVTDGQGAVLPLPERAQPPMASSGLLAAKEGAANDVRDVTGQHEAALGLPGNERSGRAIFARQRESDIGTYHYIDNLSRAIRHIGRQLIDLIPKIYDTERIALIMGEDGESDMAKFNPSQPEAVREIKDQDGIVIQRIYNPNVGKYNVMSITGPGYSTRRQEALEAMSFLIQGNPDLWQVAGDLFVKNMDWPGAQEMADRFKKVVDPRLLADDKDPAIAAANMQIQQLTQENEQMRATLLGMDNTFKAKEIEVKQRGADIDAYNAETNRIKATMTGMTEQQIHDIVMGTLAAAIQSGDLTRTIADPISDQQVEPIQMPQIPGTTPPGNPLI